MKIYVEDKAYDVKEGTNLLHACLGLGFDIPYFCWHPAMHSVGSCRLCAVKQFKDGNDKKGRIIMSCMTPVSEGMRISIKDEEVNKFRAGIIELLMINHPHDCPVCDEGGECHLQDMTLMSGHIYRRFRHRKRTFTSQYLGPFVNHEMNRCIHCYRCLRFYRNFAGGRDLDAFASHRFVYFGRYEDGALENVFSGNLVEVCPTGVFTDKTLKRHYTRKWDLQTAPSVCVHCGVGCNTLPGERYGTLRRILNRYNSEINGYFLCDRGRFGYEYVNHNKRLRRPSLGNESPQEDEGGPTIQRDRVFSRLAPLLHFGAKIIGIGSPRASLESNYALRTLVGPENFSSGMSQKESEMVAAIIGILRNGPARSASLKDAAQADAVLVLGEDVMNTAPILALALRQSVRNRAIALAEKLGIPEWNETAVRITAQDEKGPLFITSHDKTGLDDIALEVLRAAPDDQAVFGFAIAHDIDHSAPAITHMSRDHRSLARRIADTLKDAERPLIVCGTGCASVSLIHAAANIAWALCRTGRQASLCYAVPECNSLGVGLLDAQDITQAFEAAENGEIETAIVLENDIYRRAEEEHADRFFSKVPNVVVIDYLENKTVLRADILLASTSAVESDGTLVSSEGRAQRFFRVFVPEGEEEESLRWLSAMLSAAGRPEGERWKTIDDIITSLSSEMDVFSSLPSEAPAGTFRINGQKVPRQPHRYSGRTAMHAHQTIYEPRPPDDPDSPLSFSMEGYNGMPPAALVSRYWSPGWNSVQALNKYQRETGGPLRGGDPGKRLIEPGQKEIRYFDDIPEAFKAETDKLLFIPLYHIFGSEELSALSPAVAEMTPGPYIVLNEKDAEQLNVENGKKVTVSIKNVKFSLPARVSQCFTRGTAGLPAGLPSLQRVILPAHGKIEVDL